MQVQRMERKKITFLSGLMDCSAWNPSNTWGNHALLDSTIRLKDIWTCNIMMIYFYLALSGVRSIIWEWLNDNFIYTTIQMKYVPLNLHISTNHFRNSLCWIALASSIAEHLAIYFVWVAQFYSGWRWAISSSLKLKLPLILNK